MSEENDPLKPPVSLLVKLGSIIVHADEYLSPNGHPFDKVAFENGLNDGEVQRWIQEMTGLAFLPVKRAPAARAAPGREEGASE